MGILGWAFGGVGGAVLVAAAGWFYFDHRGSEEPQQSQRAGDNSINIQAGHDIRIGNDDHP
jgi:hypothetical protein